MATSADNTAIISPPSQLLILDLDETLVRVEEQPLDRAADFELDAYWVYIRPYAFEFLKFCRQHFRVAVWTSSTEMYAIEIVRRLFGEDYPLEFLWARKRCVLRFDPERCAHEWVKDLKKVKRRGFALERVIMVDDTPQKLVRNYGNLVYIKPFEGDPRDDELRALMRYLLELKEEINIRIVEKRGWRQRPSGREQL